MSPKQKRVSVDRLLSREEVRVFEIEAYVLSLEAENGELKDYAARLEAYAAHIEGALARYKELFTSMLCNQDSTVNAVSQGGNTNGRSRKANRSAG